MKLAGRWRNVERRGPRTHIRGQLMATIADSSPLTESTLLRALIAVWVLFDAYALAARSIRHNTGDEQLAGLFFEAYDLGEVDWQRVDSYILLDELF